MLSFKVVPVVFLSILLIAFQAFADCGSHLDDLNYRQLDWSEVAVYRVNTPYADVYGIMCAGVDADGRMMRAHYRDNQGVRVYKSLGELKAKDVVFFARDDFPPAARWLLRDPDPLTIRVTSEKKLSQGRRAYGFSAKFLRNPRKGFYAADFREIKLEYTSGINQTTYQNERLDEISLNISAALNINEVLFRSAGRTSLKLDPFDLPQTRRRP